MKHYNANQVNVSLAGKTLSGGGLADGLFFMVKRKTESFTSKAGSDGEVTRSKTNDKRGEFEIHTMQTSDDNAWLSGLLALDENTENGAGVGALSCEDKNGTSLHFAQNAWLTGPPECPYGREADERVWKGECDLLDSFVGGT